MLTTDDKMIRYCEIHCGQSDPILDALDRETHLKTLSPRMLSGKLQGEILTLLSKLISPKSILEIGTFTGYSAICLAKGLTPEGKLITIDIDPEYRYIAEKYFDLAGMSSKIQYITGDAKYIIPSLSDVFDLVFIDADKDAYATYYDLVIEKVRPGGLILADNVLWSGKVLDEKMDKKTKAIDDFNKMLTADPRVANIILPIRDGIHLARKL